MQKAHSGFLVNGMGEFLLNPQRVVSPGWSAALYTLAVGLTATLILFIWIRWHEETRQDSDFRRRAGSIIVAVQSGLDEAAQQLTMLNQLFNSVDQVSREQFSSFASPIVQRYPYIQRMSFQRLVTRGERPGFEARRRQQFPGFSITESRDGKLVPAGQRNSYRVVDYLVPMEGNAAILGMDANSISWLNAAPISDATDSGMMTMTQLVNIPLERSSERSFVMVVPVYRFGSQPKTVPQRRLNIIGYTSAVFRAGDLVEKILASSGRVNVSMLNLSVYLGPVPERRFLAFGSGDLPQSRSGWLGARDWLFHDQPKVLRQSFTLSGHVAHMLFWSPPQPFLDAHPGSLIVLIVGLLSSGFAAVYLRAIKSRSERIARLVDERTLELTQSEELQRGQNRILHIIASGEEVQTVLDETILFIEQHISGTGCVILLANDEGTAFNRRAGPSVPPALLQRLVQLPIESGMGAPADVVLSHAPLMVADIASEPVMGRVRDAFLAQGYAACGCWPIISKRGKILGALVILYGQTGLPAPHDARMAGIATDLAGIVVETRWAEDRIRHMAHYDELTGLPNRFLYAQYLNKAIAQAKRQNARVGVLFIDLDRFKNINETFSQEIGDAVLRDMSLKLGSCLRDPDSIARSGGDEFIVLVESCTDLRYLGEVAQRLLVQACQPFLIDGQECRLSASIGIATYPDDGEDGTLLLKNADIAMYRAKAMNRNNYQFYSAEMNTHTVERLAFEAMLRRAIERREFVAYYQPKVDVRSGRIVGAEALVRWNHPQQGLLMPGKFIAVAEEAGLIGRIGMMVLENACRDINLFGRLGIEFGRIAINLSAVQFTDVNLLDDIDNVVTAYDVLPHALEFEITESMVMHNRDQAIELMDGIKARGFTLSIDDFGTGYSSLAYLKRFPVDSVKIDKSFINDITVDANDSAIVQAIIVMSHALGMKVIAEGVETPDQLAMLESFRCNAYQGWYYSKAVPAQEFITLVRQQVEADILALEAAGH